MLLAVTAVLSLSTALVLKTPWQSGGPPSQEVYGGRGSEHTASRGKVNDRLRRRDGDRLSGGSVRAAPELVNLVRAKPGQVRHRNPQVA
jgi:hypothetical protein